MSSSYFHNSARRLWPEVSVPCSLGADTTSLTLDSDLCLWCHLGFEEFQSSISVTGYWIDDAQQHINKYHSSNPAEEIVRRSWWLQFQLKQLGYELPNKEEK